MAKWRIEGHYMETCNCRFICPCISSNLTAAPSEGDCKAAVAMTIERGQKDGVDLAGLSFIVLMHAPGAMADGNIKVGLIVDERADAAQAEAITAIATGAAGGPMGALAPLVGEFGGVIRSPISVRRQGLSHSITAGTLVDQAMEGVASAADPDQAICLDNTCHPAASRLALAHATRSHFNAFGLSWHDTSGTRNGHFAPFAWAG